MINRLRRCRPLFLLLIISLLSHQAVKAQIHLYFGKGFGSYCHFQGSLDTRAFEFNNYTDVPKPLEPNRGFSGTTLGANLNLGRFVVGLDWAGKRNVMKGKRNDAGGPVEDKFIERLNTYYINFGVGNKVDPGSGSANGSKLTWRIQTAFGFYGFRLIDDLSGTSDDFKGTLGKTRGISCRTGLNLWYPVYKKWSLNLLPYYEFDTTGGYVEVPEDRERNSEFFNISNYGLNINLDYAF